MKQRRERGRNGTKTKRKSIKYLSISRSFMIMLCMHRFQSFSRPLMLSLSFICFILFEALNSVRVCRISQQISCIQHKYTHRRIASWGKLGTFNTFSTHTNLVRSILLSVSLNVASERPILQFSLLKTSVFNSLFNSNENYLLCFLLHFFSCYAKITNAHPYTPLGECECLSLCVR